MYYWLKYDDESEDRYVISDSDEIVYLVYTNGLGQSVASKHKMEKHQLLRFKPYFEIEETTEYFISEDDDFLNM